MRHLIVCLKKQVVKIIGGGGGGDKQGRLNKRSGRRPKVFAEMLKN